MYRRLAFIAKKRQEIVFVLITSFFHDFFFCSNEKDKISFFLYAIKTENLFDISPISVSFRYFFGAFAAVACRFFVVFGFLNCI